MPLRSVKSSLARARPSLPPSLQKKGARKEGESYVKEGRKESEFVPHAEKIGFLHMIKVRSLRKFEFGIASFERQNGRRRRKPLSRHGLDQMGPRWHLLMRMQTG